MKLYIIEFNNSITAGKWQGWTYFLEDTEEGAEDKYNSELQRYVEFGEDFQLRMTGYELPEGSLIVSDTWTFESNHISYRPVGI